MNVNMNTFLQRSIVKMTMLTTFLAGGLVPLAQATDVDTSNLEVTATIIATACNIEMSPAGGVTLAVDSADLVTGKVSKTEPVTLTLKDCGLGYISKKPTVTVSGLHPDPTDVPPGDDPLKLFKDAPDSVTNNSEGYWVVVTSEDSPEMNDLYTEGESVFIGQAAVTPNGQSGDIHIGVSCMNSDPCGKQAGTLKATLTFTFKYQ